MESCEIPLRKRNDFRWEIPVSYKDGMRVPGLVFADEKLMKEIRSDRSLEQVANVAHLPGIVGYSLGMPDIHWGYGFPIGGVAATDPDYEGVISPGGIGYDINCGVRLVRSNLEMGEIRGRMKDLVAALFRDIPCGVGSKGDVRLSEAEEKRLLKKGARWVVEKGFGSREDLERTEAGGCLEDADPDALSHRAIERGLKQSGTLGSGNHFCEVQVVEKTFNPASAEAFGLFEGQIVVMIHSGSRGLGYQVCDDSLKVMRRMPEKYGIKIPDRQLACAPLHSEEGMEYYTAMCAAANYAWANRQHLMASVRRVFERVLKASPKALGMDLVYDVAHNIGKFEEHKWEGKRKRLFVHRKGATRAFPAGHPELPDVYREVGQPVIIPGDMGRNSYLLVGTEVAMKETFGSVCHGAGRRMSRHQSVRTHELGKLLKELKERGVVVMAEGKRTILEEAPDAYKDVNDVVDVVHKSGLARRVARMRPLGVIKG